MPSGHAALFSRVLSGLSRFLRLTWKSRFPVGESIRAQLAHKARPAAPALRGRPGCESLETREAPGDPFGLGPAALGLTGLPPLDPNALGALGGDVEAGKGSRPLSSAAAGLSRPSPEWDNGLPGGQLAPLGALARTNAALTTRAQAPSSAEGAGLGSTVFVTPADVFRDPFGTDPFSAAGFSHASAAGTPSAAERGQGADEGLPGGGGAGSSGPGPGEGASPGVAAGVPHPAGLGQPASGPAPDGTVTAAASPPSAAAPLEAASAPPSAPATPES